MQLTVKNLNIQAQFAKGEAPVVKGVDFCVSDGRPLAIVGESGSGKTMCALALLGLLPQNCFADGSAMLDGVELIGMSERAKNRLRGNELVYIPQSGAEFLNPALKIKTQMYQSLKKIGVKGKSLLRKSAFEALAKAGLDGDEVFEKYPHQISGGQAQRVVLALSLCSHAKLVIADEPTKGIDRQTAKLFEESLKDFFNGACVIVITHDMELAGRCDDILVLKDGEAVEYGAARDVLSNPQADHTKLLIAAMPNVDKEDDHA